MGNGRDRLGSALATRNGFCPLGLRRPDQLPAALMLVLRSGDSIPLPSASPFSGGKGGAVRFPFWKSRVLSQFSLLPPPADGLQHGRHRSLRHGLHHLLRFGGADVPEGHPAVQPACSCLREYGSLGLGSDGGGQSRTPLLPGLRPGTCHLPSSRRSQGSRAFDPPSPLVNRKARRSTRLGEYLVVNGSLG